MGIYNGNYDNNNNNNIHKNDDNDLSDKERIFINLMFTKQNPIKNLIIQYIYPKLTDFSITENVQITTSSYISYLNILSYKEEISPLNDQKISALNYVNTIDQLKVRNYTFSFIFYVRDDSTAIAKKLRVLAMMNGGTVDMDIILIKAGINNINFSFTRMFTVIKFFLQGAGSNIPETGFIELLYYGLYYT